MSGRKFTWRHVVRKILSLVFSRLVVTGILLLVQFVWLFVLFFRLSEYAAWVNGVGLALSVLMCLALIRQDSTVPEFKISWLILFTVMPVQGGLLYLLWGDKRPAIRLRHRLERAEAQLVPLRTADPAAQELLEHRDQVGTAAVLPLPDIVTVHGSCLLPAPVGHIPEAYSVLLQEF